MQRDAPIGWMDSAAVGATLFLNLFVFEHLGAPVGLARFPLQLTMLAALSGLVAGAAFYLAGRGAASSENPAMPMESRVGRIAYLCAVSTLLIPLCILCASTVSFAFMGWWTALTGYPLPRFGAPVPKVESGIWIAWAVFVASRGRPAVARAARTWAWAGLMLLLGGCLAFRREIAAFAATEGHTVHWDFVVNDLQSLTGFILPLTCIAGLFAPARRSRLARSMFLGAGGGLAATLILLALCLAGLSLRIHDGDMLHFWILARQGTGGYGEARFLVVALTLMPLMRLAALALVEALRAVRAPLAGPVTFLAFAAYGLMAGSTAWWRHMSQAAVLAACVAGVLSGRGLARLLALPTPRTAAGAERLGLVAAALTAAAVSFASGAFSFDWDPVHGDLGIVLFPYLAAEAATACAGLLPRPAGATAGATTP